MVLPVVSTGSKATSSTFTSQSEMGQLPVLSSTGDALGNVICTGEPDELML